MQIEKKYTPQQTDYITAAVARRGWRRLGRRLPDAEVAVIIDLGKRYHGYLIAEKRNTAAIRQMDETAEDTYSRVHTEGARRELHELRQKKVALAVEHEIARLFPPNKPTR